MIARPACPDCHGEGAAGCPGGYLETCDRCGGSGMATREKSRYTPGMTTPEDIAARAARLRAAREAAGLSRADLAERLGASYSLIANAENGKAVTLDWLWAVARAIGCDPHGLDERLASNRPARKRSPGPPPAP